MAPLKPGSYKGEFQLWVDGLYFGPRLTLLFISDGPIAVATTQPTQSSGPSVACLRAQAYLQYIQSYCQDRQAALLVARDVQGLTELRAWCDREIQYASSIQAAYCAP